MSIVENSKRELTYEDYLGIPEDRQRHEIIDGDHFVTPSPVSYHQILCGNLFVQLYRQVQEPGLGTVLFAPLDVLLSKVDIVQPDIVVVPNENDSIITEKNVRGAPDLLVEILSPSTSDRDRNLKKTRYQRAGVREYWIVDPETKQVEQYALTGDAYTLVATDKKTISSRVCSSVTVNLAKVW